jgi:hypothetical protein
VGSAGNGLDHQATHPSAAGKLSRGTVDGIIGEAQAGDDHEGIGDHEEKDSERHGCGQNAAAGLRIPCDGMEGSVQGTVARSGGFDSLSDLADSLPDLAG